MLLKRGFYLSCFALATVFMVGGCASSVFPDFEDYNEIIVDDGGKVEIREVDARGILVSDKENASYEDDDLIENEAEEITPAKVVAVETAEIDPLPSEEQKELVDNLDETTTIVKEDEKVNEKVVIADEEDEDKITEPTVNYLAATIYFENGGAVVASSYNKVLRDVAKIVKDNNAKVMVYGFASSRTKDTDPASHKLANFKVSADRATNTAKAFAYISF